MVLLKHITEHIGPYLDVCDYFKLRYVTRLKFNIAEAMLSNSPPPCGPARLKLWKSLLLIHSTNETCESRISIEQFDRLASEHASEATSLSLGQLGEIMRDVLRTFPTHPFFKIGNPGEKMLSRILRAIASFHSDIGYCQGMNFVVGVLILGRMPFEITGGVHLPSAVYVRNPDVRDESSSETSDQAEKETSTESKSVQENEEVDGNCTTTKISFDYCKEEYLQAEYDIFVVLDLIMQRQGKLGMGGLWQSHAPIMKLRVYQLDRILNWMLPRLHAHFIDIQMTPEVIVAQWFVTMFSYTVPLQWTMQIWGYIFYEGWPALFRVVLSLLQLLEDTLLDIDLEGLGMMMKNWKSQVLSVASSHHEIMRNAHTMILNDEVLAKLQEAYALEIISLSELATPIPTQPPQVQIKDPGGDSLGSNTAMQVRDSVSGPNVVDEDGTVSHISSNSSFQSLQVPTNDPKRDRSGSSGSAASSTHSAAKSPRTPIATPVGPLMNPHSSGAPNTRAWHFRYHEAMPDYIIADILRVRDELKELDASIDRDKSVIQNRIQQACFDQSIAQMDFDIALKDQLHWIVDVSQYSQDREVALYQAARIAFAVSMDINDLKLDTDEIPLNPQLLTLDGFPRTESGASLASSMAANHSTIAEGQADEDDEDNSRESYETECEMRGELSASEAYDDNNIDACESEGIAKADTQVEVSATPAKAAESRATAPPSTAVAPGLYSFVELDSDDDSPMRFALNASQNIDNSVFISPLMASGATEQATPSAAYNLSEVRPNGDDLMLSCIDSVSTPILPEKEGGESTDIEEEILLGTGPNHSLFSGDSDDETPLKATPQRESNSSIVSVTDSQSQDSAGTSDNAGLALDEENGLKPSDNASAPMAAGGKNSRFTSRPFLSRLFKSKNEQVVEPSKEAVPPPSKLSPSRPRPILDAVARLRKPADAEATDIKANQQKKYAGETSPNKAGKVRVGYRVFQLLSKKPLQGKLYDFPPDQCPWYCTLSLQQSPSFDFDIWSKQRMKHCQEQSKLCQQKIIQVSRALESAKHNLSLATEKLTRAKEIEEAAAEVKKKSCDELQQLVEDANRARSQKLKYITDSYMM